MGSPGAGRGTTGLDNCEWKQNWPLILLNRDWAILQHQAPCPSQPGCCLPGMPDHVYQNQGKAHSQGLSLAAPWRQRKDPPGRWWRQSLGIQDLGSF